MQNGEQLTTSPANVQPETLESGVSFAPPLKAKKNRMWLWISGATILIIVIAVMIAYALHRKTAEEKNNQAAQIKSQQVDTGNLSPTASSFSVENDKVLINGLLQADQNLVITPTAQPQTAITGLIYLDKASGELRYYNGQEYVSLVAGTGAGAVGGQVTSLQGSTGALTLLGSGGMTISTNGTNISLNLPQNLTITANPTFGSLTLNSPLAISSGGTGVSSFAVNGVVISDNSGALDTATGADGLCLISGTGPGGVPGFASCVGGGASVASLNGGTGTITLANATNPIGVNGTITIDDASTSAKGIAQFNSTNFTVASGVVNTIQDIDSGASPTFAALNVDSSGGGTITLQAVSTASNFTITLPAEDGTICTTAGSVACTNTYASASGSGQYIQFAPASAQEDSSSDPFVSTIYLRKTTQVGDIVRIQGTGASGTADAFRIQADGDIYFQSLNQSDTAFRVLGYDGSPVLGISTKPPAPITGWDCTVDFENPQPPGGGDCVTNDYTSFLPFDESPGSGTTTSLNTNIIYAHDGLQSLQVLNGSGATTNHGTYYPITLSWNKVYTVSYYALRSGNVAGSLPKIHAGYFRGSSPYAVGAVRDVTCGAKTISKYSASRNNWRKFTCTFTISDDTGNHLDANGLYWWIGAGDPNKLPGEDWYLDDILLVQGSSTSTYTNLMTVGAPLQVIPSTEYVEAFKVVDDAGSLFNVDTVNRQVTVSRVDNTEASQTLPALIVQNDNGAFISAQDTSGAELVALSTSGTGGSIVLHPSAGSSNTGTIKLATLNSARTYTLPNATGTICLSSGNCVGAGSASTLQAAYDASTGGTTPEILLDSTRAGLDIQDASSTIGTNLLNIWASGVDISTGDPLFSVGSTGIVTLQNSVDSAAALLVNNLAGNTILNVDTTSGLVGIGNGSNAFLATLDSSALSVNRAFTFPDAAGEICTDSGNCDGAGNSVTSSGGTPGYIAKFTTDGQTIGDSILSESLITLTAAGNMVLQGTAGVADLTLGVASTSRGQLTFANANDSRTVTLIGPSAVSSSSKTITLPDETGTVCLQNSSNCGFAAGGGGNGNYIQNQFAGAQTSSNFWISGTGRADTALQAPLFDTPSGTTTLAVGTTNATAISLNQNTTIAAAKTLTVTSGATSLTGATSGDALTVSNSTSTGNILVLKDNSTAVLTVADGGGITGTGSYTFSGVTTDITTGTNEDLTLLANGSGVINLNDSVKVATLGSATSNSAGLCRDSSTTQLTSCDSGNTTGVPFLQGGNTFSGTTAGTLGTLNNGALNFITNTTTKLTLSTAGDLQFATGANRTISVATQTTPNTAGNSLTVAAAAGDGSGAGGAIVIQGGAGGSSGAGGAATFQSGDAAAASSGALTLRSGTGTVSSGNVVLQAGLATESANSNSTGSVTINSGNMSVLNAHTGLTTGNVLINAGQMLTQNASATGTGGSINIISGGGCNTSVFGSCVSLNQGTVAAGDINVDVGVSTGGAAKGAINIGTTRPASGITIGNSTQTGSVAIQGGTSTSGFNIQNANSERLFNVDTSTTQNLILNGGFEIATTGWLSSLGTVSAGSTLSRVTTAQQQGNGSLSIVTTAAANQGAGYLTGASTLTSYTLSLWASVSSGSMTTFEIGYGDGLGSVACLSSQTLTTTWAYFTCSFTTGSGALQYIYVKQTDATARTILIDSVQFEGGSTATTFNPGGQLQLLGTINSPVTIKPKTDSTAIFQIQNAAGASLFTVDSANKHITINSKLTTMTAPGTLTMGTSTTGGTLAAATYFYKVTAIDSAGGETNPSPENSQVTTGTTSTVSVSWTAVSGASGYRIYRSTSTGTEVYLTTVLTNSFTDTGSFTAGTATPPSVNTAVLGSNSGNSGLQLSVGGLGTPTGQLYVSGSIPSSAIGTAATGTTPISVVVQGRYAYVVNQGSNTLAVYDVSNPVNPVLLSTTATGTAPISLAVQDKYAYVANLTSNTLQIFDISNPTSPSSVGSVGTLIGPRWVYVQGRYAYVTMFTSGALQIFDVSNPTSPVTVSTLTVGTNPRGVFAQGRYAYVANSTSSNFQIIDVSNPASPSSVSTTSSGTTPWTLYVQGRYAYVVDQNGGGTGVLRIYDVSNPASPSAVGSVNTGAGPQFVFVQGRYAFVTNNSSTTMSMFDVSNPASPFSLGTVTTGSTPRAVSVAGRYAYVLVGTNLQIYDIGGAYVQQLEAGGAEVGSLTVNARARIAGDATIQGSLSVGSSIQTSGNLGVAGNSFLQGSLSVAGGVLGGLTLSSLSAPSTPTVTPQGTVGTTSYSYTVTAVSASGGESVASSAGSTSTGNATLSSTNYNQVTWSGVSGAVSYKVYRTASSGTPSSTGLIGTTSGLVLNDTGLAGSGTSPTVNTTGNFTVTGSSLFKPATDTTTAFQVQDAGGSNTLFGIDTTGNGTINIQGIADRGVINIGTTKSLDVTIGKSGGTSTLTVHGGSQFNGNVTINGHIITGNTASTTSIASNANCGTGCTVSVSGNDTNGLITINTGTGAAAGIQATVTFAIPYGVAPKITITPETVPATSTFPLYYYGSSTTTFDLKVYTALTDSVTYKFSYHTLQ